MRESLLSPLSLIIFFLITLFLGISQIIASSVATHASDQSLVMWSKSLKPVAIHEQIDLANQVLERVKLYEILIKDQHLSAGMIITRSLIDRSEMDQCDSLLFSSIRYVALKKLGFRSDAEAAWLAIERSRKNGIWLRHPNCSKKSISRDMLTGVLLALLQNPLRSKEYLQSLVNQIDQKSGYFSHGPVYVSYLTPGLGKIIRLLGDHYGIPTDSFPDIVKRGYSTNELSVILLKPGYEAHLAGLALWLELELENVLKIREKPGNLEYLYNFLIRPFSKREMNSQSFSWTAKRLFEIDHHNLFFTYLRLRAAGAMNAQTASILLKKLVIMREFPTNQLPSDCERRADYAWQRSPKNLQTKSLRCNYQFPGVDFIWMASLLISSLDIDMSTEINPSLKSINIED